MRLPEPLIVPSKLVELLSPPVVSVPLPSVTLPSPSSEPILSSKLFRSNTPGLVSDTRDESAIRSLPPSFTEPFRICVTPV